MKQKNSSSNLVTKTVLKDELINLETRVDIKLDRMENRIDDNAKKYRDQILTSNDKLAKQLEEMRDENAIGFNQVARLQKQVNSHATRIQKLEHAQQITT